MSDRTPAEMYHLARRLARRLYGREGHAWVDREKHWHGDRCCAGRRYLDRVGDRQEFIRRGDWYEVVKVLQAAIAAKPARAA